MLDIQLIVNKRVPGLAKRIQKKEKPFDFSLVVDYTGKISNLLEDIRKVEKFAQYVDNQAGENLTEMEGSQE